MLSHDELVILETARLAAQRVIDGPGRESGSAGKQDRKLRGGLVDLALEFISSMDELKTHHGNRNTQISKDKRNE
jgi:hypothetical protein